LTDVVEKGLRKVGITVSRPVLYVICIILGIVFPALVGIIVCIFLLIQGILLLTDYYEINRQQPRTYRTPPAQPSEQQPATPPIENP
jgi:cytoskeletal protein RodZ